MVIDEVAQSFALEDNVAEKALTDDAAVGDNATFGDDAAVDPRT